MLLHPPYDSMSYCLHALPCPGLTLNPDLPPLSSQPLALPCPGLPCRHAASFFSGLDAYLREHSLKIEKVFSTFDVGAKGYLRMNELDALVLHMMPDASQNDLKYFQVAGRTTKPCHIPEGGGGSRNECRIH